MMAVATQETAHIYHLIRSPGGTRGEQLKRRKPHWAGVLISPLRLGAVVWANLCPPLRRQET